MFAFLLLHSACSTTHQPVDTQADAKLGLNQEEQTDDAQDALKKLQDIRAQEQKRNLERQITDPVTSRDRVGG